MTKEAAEAKAKSITAQVTAQLDEHLAALLMIARNDGCTVVINIAPEKTSAWVDFQPPKRKLKI